MTEPLITVITVTFNASKVLAPTMRSVSEQTFTDYEHLIVDGASSDNTLDIARELGSNLTIYSRRDSGIYHGMNRGLKLARGKYVLFLNAGDRFASSDTLGEYARFASEGSDIIYGDTVIINDEGEILRPRHLSAPQELTIESFKNGMLVCHQAFMVKKEIAPLYDRKYRFSADYEWTIRCMQNTDSSRCSKIEGVTIHYLDNGTTEQNKIASLKERFSIMHNHFGLIPTILRHISFIPRALLHK